MANLKTFSGFPIQNLTSDPVPFAQAKENNPYAGSWASGTNVNTARRSMASAGTQTASIITGGLLPPGTYDETEVWNGSAWTEVADLNTGRYYLKGSGTSTAALAYGGVESNPTASAKTELWNGSGWTETGDLNTARQKIGNSTTGTTTASIAFGGSPSDPAGGGALTINESWNGSTWTEVGDLNSARKGLGGSGTSTAALAIAGNVPPVSALNESWNGSAWTEIGDLNTAREQGGTAGTQTSAITWSGYPDSPGVLTEQWNGSAWTEVSDLANKQIASGSAGVSGESAAAISGYNGSSNVATVEEWSFTGLNPATTPAADYSDAIVGQMYYNSTSGQFKAIKNGGPPIGSFSSGGNLPTNYINQGAFGGRDSVTTGGGSKASGSPARVGDSFQYNGVAWSEIAELNTARDQAAGLGTQNSGLVAGGYSASPTATVGVCENWNGSSWTEIADVSPVRTGAGTAGVYTAGLVFGGSPQIASTMTWNGSTWTEVNDLNDGRNRFMGQAVGTQTASLAMEGEYYPNTGDRGSEEWDGSSWTSIANMNTARQLGGGSGITTLAIAISGRGGAPGYNPSALVESWNGTAFTEVADVSSARAYLSSAGTAGGNPGNTSIIFGGATTSSTANSAATEEWNAADFEIKSLTTS